MFVRDHRGFGRFRVGSGVYFGQIEGAGRGTPFYAEVGAYTILVPRGDGGPAIPPSVPPDYPTPSSSLTSSSQSATPSSQTMAWGMYRHVSSISSGFFTRPS